MILLRGFFFLLVIRSTETSPSLDLFLFLEIKTRHLNTLPTDTTLKTSAAEISAQIPHGPQTEQTSKQGDNYHRGFQ